MIGKTLGRYQIKEKLGAGGMGEVYRARDERLDRDVALKFLSAAHLEDTVSRRRFRKEALVLSKLSHPNIATILDYDTQEGVDFLVMEYIEGATLMERLTRGPMSEKEILQVAIQTAAALEDAHAMSIVHRDLKPSNIILTTKGQIKVLDFGLARWTEPTRVDLMTQVTTETHAVAGTLPYMAPEQLRAETIDARTDIYSFGIVLYEMCTGQRPYNETTSITLADAILHKPVPPPGRIRHDLTPRLEEIILKCVEKDPENRYQSAKELLVDLRRIAFPSAAEPTSPSPFLVEGSRTTRRLLATAGISIALLVAVILGVKVVQERRSSTPQTAGSVIHSIVALPSKVYGPDENRFLTDAIPSALAAQLIEVRGVEVKVPPTSLDLERIGGDLTGIAEAYGVNALILSSITTEVDHFLLNVQLMETPSRRLVWSRDYSGPRGHYLELVRSAAEGLRSVLRPESAPIPSMPRTASSPEAQLSYQRGIYHLRGYVNQKRPEDFEKALSDFKQSLDLDSTMADAAASIAQLYVAKLESGARLREILPEIDRWAYRALQLDHQCGEAWQVLSVAEEMRPDGDQRNKLEYALRAAVYSNRSAFSHHVLASALSRNSLQLSLEASQESVRQEPLFLNGLLFAAGLLEKQGKTSEGLALIDRALRLETDMPVAVLMKTFLLLVDHRFGDAEKLIEPLDQMVATGRLHPGWVDYARDWLEQEKSVASGNARQPGSPALKQLVDLARGQAPPFPRWELLTGDVLVMQARLDSTESAIETLAVRAAKGIFEPYDWLMLKPELEPLRKHSQFKELSAQSRSEFEKMVSILEEARKRNELPSYLEKPLDDVSRLLR